MTIKFPKYGRVVLRDSTSTLDYFTSILGVDSISDARRSIPTSVRSIRRSPSVKHKTKNAKTKITYL